MNIYPLLSTFEKLLYVYISTDVNVQALANVSEAHPNNVNDLGGKSQIVIGFLNYLQPCMSRSEIDAAYQIVCWSTSFAKSRQLQEILIQKIELWDKPASIELQVLTPVLEKIQGADFSSKALLYFCSIVYRFPLVKN